MRLWAWFRARPKLRVVASDNSPERVNFRQSVMALQRLMEKGADEGAFERGEYPLRHYFTPISEKYGCCVYAREIGIPKGHLVIGKIHRHAHLNFIMKGKVSVATEFGRKYFEAPCIFVSEPGLKRAVVAEEDTIWVTVHLSKYAGEENLNKIEDEVIAKTYNELGLIEEIERLRIGERK